MRYPKIRELIEAITSLVSKPYTTKFPHKEHVPEIRYRGKPHYYEESCVGCGACKEVCPSGCIKMIDDAGPEDPKRRLELHYDSCLFCGQCQAACITKEGIKLTNKFEDLSTFDRKEAIEAVEKELMLCEVCKSIVGAKDHLAWVADKLGPIAYSSPTLYLLALKKLKTIYSGDPDNKETLTRQDRIKVLCPKCRRDITLNT